MKVRDIMKGEALIVDENAKAREIAHQMIAKSYHQVFLEDGRSITAEDVFHADPEEKAGKMARNRGVLSPEDDAKEALRKIILSGAEALPVMEKGKVIGVLGKTDYLNLVEEEPITYATRDVVSVQAEDSAAKAHELMEKHRIGGVAVVKNEKLVGMVSEIDLLKIRAEEWRGRSPIVSNIMTRLEPIDEPTREEILEHLRRHDVFYFTKHGIPYALVTVSQMVESLLVEKPAVPVRTIGIDEPMAAEKLRRFGEKMSRMVKIEGIIAHAKEARETTEIRVRVYTSIGNFVYSTTSSDILSGIDEAIDSLEEQIKSKKEKIRDLRRRMYLEF